jgi:hypothetical protein
MWWQLLPELLSKIKGLEISSSPWLSWLGSIFVELENANSSCKSASSA